MNSRLSLGAISAVLASSFLLAGCSTDNTDQVVAESVLRASDSIASVEDAVNDEPISSERITLVVYGMSCPLCATNVDKQLLAVDGVRTVEVDLSTGRIDVALAEAPRPTTRQLAAAIEKSGFTLMDIKLN